MAREIPATRPDDRPAAVFDLMSRLRPRQDGEFSPAERVRLRAMMAAFDKLTAPNGCPVARSILDD